MESEEINIVHPSSEPNETPLVSEKLCLPRNDHSLNENGNITTDSLSEYVTTKPKILDSESKSINININDDNFDISVEMKKNAKAENSDYKTNSMNMKYETSNQSERLVADVSANTEQSGHQTDTNNTNKISGQPNSSVKEDETSKSDNSEEFNYDTSNEHSNVQTNGHAISDIKDVLASSSSESARAIELNGFDIELAMENENEFNLRPRRQKRQLYQSAEFTRKKPKKKEIDKNEDTYIPLTKNKSKSSRHATSSKSEKEKEAKKREIKEDEDEEDDEDDTYVPETKKKSSSTSKTEEAIEECDVCHKYFTRKKLAPHKLAVHPYTCMICEDIFSSNNDLIKHKEEHKNMVFSCESCEMSYSDHKEYELHNMMEHEEPKTNYKCKECTLSFPVRCRLIYHFMKHYPKSYKCDQCPKMYSTIKSLDTHKKVHTDSFPCPECGKTLFNKKHSDYHMICHTGVKPYQCLYCGKGFNSRSQREVHTRIHLNLRPFECNICSVRFRQRTDLQRHMGTHNKKQYQCNICKKRYSTLLYVTQHMKVHNNDEYQYECPLCDSKFTYFHLLKKHTQRYHDNSQHPCNDCGLKFNTRDDLVKHFRSNKHKNAMHRKIHKQKK